MMDVNQRRRLSQWLRRQLFGRSDEKCARIVIKHVEVGGKVGNEVDSFPIEQISDNDIDMICTQIETSCLADAEGTKEFQRYAVMAYTVPEGEGEKAKARSFGRCMLSFTSFSEDEFADDSSASSEPATKNGLLSQLMRHNESMHKMTIASMGHVISTQTRMLQQAQEHIEKIGHKDLETFELIENLMSQKHNRELESMKAVSNQESKEKIANQIVTLIPNIVNRLGGKKLLPERTTPIEQMLSNLLKGMTPDQLGALQNVLRPDQQIAVFEFMAKMKETEEKEQESKSKLTVVGSSGAGE